MIWHQAIGQDVCRRADAFAKLLQEEDAVVLGKEDEPAVDASVVEVVVLAGCEDDFRRGICFSPETTTKWSSKKPGFLGKAGLQLCSHRHASFA
jgi:hypothetical protein